MCDYGGEKWDCDKCTYSNYPASKKCTICHAPRQSSRGGGASGTCSSYIDDEAPLLIIPPSPKKILSSRKIIEGGDEWTCMSCKYELNSIKSKWCNSCHFHRDATVADMNVENSSRVLISPPLPKLKPSKHAAEGGDVEKWTCTRCTYLNFKASGFCIMCKLPKGGDGEDSEVPSLSMQNMLITDEDKGGDVKTPPASSSSKQHPTEMSSSSSHSGSTSQQPSPPLLHSKNIRDVCDHRLYKKRKRSQLNRLFIKACIGVVEGNFDPVATYIANGGNIQRSITSDEAKYRPSAFQIGYTLVHLAIRFQRQNVINLLLDPQNSSNNTPITSSTFKRTPSNLSPDIADIIQKEINVSLRSGGANDDGGAGSHFTCYFFSEFTTFQLPVEIYDLPPSVREIMLSELIDEHAQKELEEDTAINWHHHHQTSTSSTSSNSIGKPPIAHLYALWNRSAGDCLLDSVLQATWGVFDVNNVLRSAMSSSLHQCSSTYFRRWRDWEIQQARNMGFTFNDRQLYEAWSDIHSLAQQPGASLEHCHIFVLAHILRRPIIVYGIKFLKSFRGESLGFAKFQGVYLPLFWERSFCYSSPIALGYTRGHFSALVSIETTNASSQDSMIMGGSNSDVSNKIVNLPLMDFEGNLLPIHFTSQQEEISEAEHRQLFENWMDCDVIGGHVLVAKQLVGKRGPNMTRMLDQWLDYYQNMSFNQGNFPQYPSSNVQPQGGNSSDGDDDVD